MDNDYSKVVRVKKSTKLKEENIVIKLRFERCAKQNKKAARRRYCTLGAREEVAPTSPPTALR